MNPPMPADSESEDTIRSPLFRTVERNSIAKGATKKLSRKRKSIPGIMVLREVFFLNKKKLSKPYEIVLPTSEKYFHIFGLLAKRSMIFSPFLLLRSTRPSSLSNLYFLIKSWLTPIISAKTRKNFIVPDTGS